MIATSEVPVSRCLDFHVFRMPGQEDLCNALLRCGSPQRLWLVVAGSLLQLQEAMRRASSRTLQQRQMSASCYRRLHKVSQPANFIKTHKTCDIRLDTIESMAHIVQNFRAIQTSKMQATTAYMYAQAYLGCRILPCLPTRASATKHVRLRT